MVCGPSVRRCIGVGNAGLSLDQKPTGRIVWVYLLTCQKFWVIFNELLQDKFRVTRFQRYALESAIAPEHIDCVVACHSTSFGDGPTIESTAAVPAVY